MNLKAVLALCFMMMFAQETLQQGGFRKLTGDLLAQVGKTVENAANNVADTVQDITENAGAALHELHIVEEGVPKVGEIVEVVGQSGGDALQGVQVVEQAGEGVAETVSQAGEDVADLLGTGAKKD